MIEPIIVGGVFLFIIVLLIVFEPPIRNYEPFGFIKTVRRCGICHRVLKKGEKCWHYE